MSGDGNDGQSETLAATGAELASSPPTIAGFLADRAKDSGGGIRFEGVRYTWAEVVRASAVRAALIEQWRTEPCPNAHPPEGGFHIGVLLDNVPEYVFWLGAAALAGATVVGINPTRRGAELARDIHHTHCRVLVTDAEHAPLLDTLDPTNDLGLASEAILDVASASYLDLLRSQEGAAPPSTAHLPGPAALWVLIFTSGSTGAPKAVRTSQGRAATYGSLGFSADDVLYCAMPLFHGNALTANLVPAMASGATVVLQRRFSAQAFLADARTHGVTYFNTVGRAIAYILATPETDHDTDHQVKVVLAPETAATDARAFRSRFGIPVIEGYGSSEGVIRMIPVGRGKPGALGRPDADADVVVIDPDTDTECAVAAFDGDGRLMNAGAAIGEIVRRDLGGRFEGYYNNPEADAARTRNGWFWSGDLGFRDADGVFYFAGRDLDWLRVDGENFAAAPVERIIDRHPDVAGCAVLGVPDVATGDQVLAVLELRAGVPFDPSGFAAFLLAQPDLGTKWSPRFIRIVRSLPVTGTNKVDKKPLRSEGWRTSDPIWWRRDTRSTVYERFTEVASDTLQREMDRNGRAGLVAG